MWVVGFLVCCVVVLLGCWVGCHKVAPRRTKVVTRATKNRTVSNPFLTLCHRVQIGIPKMTSTVLQSGSRARQSHCVVELWRCWVVRWLGCCVSGLLGCWVVGSCVGCWLVGLLGLWFVGLSFGCWVGRLLGSWVLGLPGVVGLLGCLVRWQQPNNPTAQQPNNQKTTQDINQLNKDIKTKKTTRTKKTTQPPNNQTRRPGGMREAIK